MTSPTISIVCVYNKEPVLADCLIRSLKAADIDNDRFEFIPLDNRESAFSSAGAALNEGVRRATGECVVMVHQDVYLHSVRALVDAADLILSDERVGVVGAVGISSDMSMRGQIRDRFVMYGPPVASLEEVDSLDEVLFMASRRRLLDEPISQFPALAWHGYAVEYGARMVSQGRTVAVARIPLTHNSMTVNLVGLAEAHATIAQLHPNVVPLQTTCGRIPAPRHLRRPGSAFARARSALGWLRDSARIAALGIPLDHTVLADPCRHLDAVADSFDLDLWVININDAVPLHDRPLTISRGERPTHFIESRSESLLHALTSRPEGTTALVTGLTARSANRVNTSVDEAAVMGYDPSFGIWMMIGGGAERPIEEWTCWRNRPLRSAVPPARLAVAAARAVSSGLRALPVKRRFAALRR